MKKVKGEIREILSTGDPKELRALFGFTKDTGDEHIMLKFNIWSRYFFVKFFTSKDAAFHEQVDEFNVRAYKGNIKEFLNIMFRGGAKTTRTKLFLAFVIANDEGHWRKYIKILSRDNKNASQITTDVYNMLISPRIKVLYPEIFRKTDTKREETMSSFTTSTGVKVVAGTIGQSQRGAIQDESRPDLIVFDDIEDSTSIRSAVITKAIWDNIEEAKNGLAVFGSCIYLANYISELGNVHRLVERVDHKLITPIEDEAGNPTWSDRYTKEDLKEIRKADDYEGEYLCQPNASKDIYFDRPSLEAMEPRRPIKEIAGFKIYKEYNPSHRYAGGHDVAGGVQLDSSTSVFIDFDCIPAQVVATFHSNTIDPEAFGDEMYSEGLRYGLPIQAPENNRFEQAILKAKQLGVNLYKTGGKAISVGHRPATQYGWNTNSLTKSTMMSGLREAIEAGLLSLNDVDLIREAKSYTRNDVIDKEPDARLVTRHFDILTSCAIAWQMKDHARPKTKPRPIRTADRTKNIAI